MRCRRAAQEATAAAEGGEGAGGRGRGGTGDRGEGGRTGVGGAAAADRGKASAKVVARRDNGFAAGSGGVRGAAARVLLAFLAAVSFRGMPGACEYKHLLLYIALRKSFAPVPTSAFN